jgi:hypothetical protein
MVKRRKKGESKRILFGFGARAGRKKRKRGRSLAAFAIVTGTIIAAVCATGVMGAGFMFLEQYVKNEAMPSRRVGSLELLGVPTWVNQELEAKISAAARPAGRDLKLDENTARLVQNNIARSVAWVERVSVQTSPETVRIAARWRKPVALLRSGSRKFYVDKDLVVLDFVSVSHLPIVEVRGLSGTAGIPAPGQAWRTDDLAAAVEILIRLERMDRLVTPDKPLLYEIDSIDVSNFDGRQSSRDSHIVLYSKDNAQIMWGAEIGTWQQHLEATDEEKLAKLYAYYKEYGTLLNGVKYINLRDPQQTIPLPVDKY